MVQQSFRKDVVGMSKEQLDHKEVQETANRMASQFKQLITAAVVSMHEYR